MVDVNTVDVDVVTEMRFLYKRIRWILKGNRIERRQIGHDAAKNWIFRSIFCREALGTTINNHRTSGVRPSIFLKKKKLAPSITL